MRIVKPTKSLYKVWISLLVTFFTIYSASLVAGMGILAPEPVVEKLCSVPTNPTQAFIMQLMPLLYLVPIVGQASLTADIAETAICITSSASHAPLMTAAKIVNVLFVAFLFAVPSADVVLMIAAAILYLTYRKNSDLKQRVYPLLRDCVSMYLQHSAIVIAILLLLAMLSVFT